MPDDTVKWRLACRGVARKGVDGRRPSPFFWQKKWRLAFFFSPAILKRILSLKTQNFDVKWNCKNHFKYEREYSDECYSRKYVVNSPGNSTSCFISPIRLIGVSLGIIERLFEKIPIGVEPLLHSDQGWQYQMNEYRRLLKAHNITQSMSRKGNCLDNSAMENFFGRLKTEMFFGETFASVEDFKQKLEEYICYFNNERVSLTLKGMSPVQYRTHST